MTLREQALIVGGSRGIGAATAIRLAKDNIDILVTYQSRRERALAVAGAARDLGVEAEALQLDICCPHSRTEALERISARRRPLSLVVLCASGGLEPGRPADYPAQINTAAPAVLATALAPLMTAGSSLIYLTSHEAHFHHLDWAHPVYGVIAESKRRGEDRLLAMRPWLIDHDIVLKIVSADVVEGTATAKLLSRLSDNAVEARRRLVGSLPKVEDVASEVVRRHAAPSAWGEVSYIWEPIGYTAGQPASQQSSETL